MASAASRPPWWAIVGTAVFVAIVPGTVVGWLPYLLTHGWQVGPPLAGLGIAREDGPKPGGGLGTRRPSPSCPRRSAECSTTRSTRGDCGRAVGVETPGRLDRCAGVGREAVPIARAMRSGRRWSMTSSEVRTRPAPRDAAPGLLSGMSGRLDATGPTRATSADARALARSTRLMSSALRSRSLGPILCA